MVWVMGGKRSGAYRHWERITVKGAHFSPPKNPQPCTACPTSHHNFPCGITLVELLITELC